MSKTSSSLGAITAFEYNCTCGKHFVNVGDAVKHVNKFSSHQLSRIAIEK